MTAIDIDDIVEKEIIDKMDLSLKVKSVEEISGSFRITVCNIKYARLLMFLTQELSDESVITWSIVKNSFQEDGSFIVSGNPGDTLSVGDILMMQKPYYFRGTPLAVNDEWREFTHLEILKLPMAWLAQPTDEDWKTDEDVLERVSDITLFFIASANFRDDLTKDHRIKQIQPLLNMSFEFVESAKSNPKFKHKDISFRTRDFSRFGKETDRGIEKNIIDSELSAIRLKMTLPIYKMSDCDC